MSTISPRQSVLLDKSKKEIKKYTRLEQKEMLQTKSGRAKLVNNFILSIYKQAFAKQHLINSSSQNVEDLFQAMVLNWLVLLEKLKDSYDPEKGDVYTYMYYRNCFVVKDFERKKFVVKREFYNHKDRSPFLLIDLDSVSNSVCVQNDKKIDKNSFYKMIKDAKGILKKEEYELLCMKYGLFGHPSATLVNLSKMKKVKITTISMRLRKIKDKIRKHLEQEGFDRYDFFNF